MTKVILRKSNRIRRKLRVKDKLFGTAQKPRLCVFRSNNYIYGSLIDDVAKRTLVDVADSVKILHKGKTKTSASKEIGKLLAARAKKAKITSAVFDRNGYMYHGRVKSLADGAREGGLVL